MSNNSRSALLATLLLFAFWLVLCLWATAATGGSSSLRASDFVVVLTAGPLFMPMGLIAAYRSFGLGDVPHDIHQSWLGVTVVFWAAQLWLHIRFVRFRGALSFLLIALVSSASCWGCVTQSSLHGSPFK